MAEWSIAAVLKTDWVNSPGGSNPSPSVKRQVAFSLAGEFAVLLILRRQGLNPLKGISLHTVGSLIPGCCMFHLTRLSV